jgi:hypothetical protein
MMIEFYYPENTFKALVGLGIFLYVYNPVHYAIRYGGSGISENSHYSQCGYYFGAAAWTRAIATFAGRPKCGHSGVSALQYTPERGLPDL